MQWKIQEPDRDIVEKLTSSLNVPEPIAVLLANRGISTYDEAKDFFRPDWNGLHDPMLMKGMREAVERIGTAISHNEKILLYGDYDVDGTTAVAFTYLFLKDFYARLDYYIPDRHTEGYGISMQGLEYARLNGCSLVIALDCGIRSNEIVKLARKSNIDFIICDHHLPGDELPDASAILNPKQPGCDYPFMDLSGCGIAFKLAQACALTFHIPDKVLERGLDLVALSIACDIVPIRGENRILTHFGLRKLNRDPLPGLRALIRVSGTRLPVTVSDLVFRLGPRINAAGRITHAREAVDAFISDSEEAGSWLAQSLDDHNETRRRHDKDTFDMAVELLRSEPATDRLKTSVVFHPDWHKGVVGIVASRLIEEFYRPTVVLTRSKDGLICGSARSVDGFDLYAALEACAGELVTFGGHKYAAGLTLKESNLKAFRKKFEDAVSRSIKAEQLEPQLTIDAELDLRDLSGKVMRLIAQMEPFGPGNPRPMFVSRDVTCTRDPRIVGGDHLKCSFRTERSLPMDAIGFRMAARKAEIDGQPFDICYSPEENTWGGQRSIQLNLKDFRSH